MKGFYVTSSLKTLFMYVQENSNDSQEYTKLNESQCPPAPSVTKLLSQETTTSESLLISPPRKIYLGINVHVMSVKRSEGTDWEKMFAIQFF